jgi:hypothetical protein
VTELRDLLAVALGQWVDDLEIEFAANEVLSAIVVSGHQVVSDRVVGNFERLHRAALALAGAELAGRQREDVWDELERALVEIHGRDLWPGEARRALAAVDERRRARVTE